MIWRSLTNAYSMISELIRVPLRFELWECLASLPEFQSIKEVPYFDQQDDWSSLHDEIFHRQAIANSGIYLNRSNQLGTSEEELSRIYCRWSFPWQEYGASLSDLSVQSHLLAHLCLYTSQHSGRGMSVAIEEQREFLSRHVLPWIFCYCTTLTVYGNEFYRAVAEFMVTTMSVHCQELGITQCPQETDTELATLEFSSLRQLAEWIGSHSQSGFFLARHSIISIGRKLGLAVGFGNRIDLLENIFSEALHYSSWAAVIEELITFSHGWQSILECYHNEGSQRWRLKNMATRRLLRAFQMPSPSDHI